MYWVVSRWQPKMGMADEWRARGMKVREAMRQMPGIEFVDSFGTENGDVCAMVGYASEEDYKRIVQDPAGPFERIIADQKLEEVANWVSSDRGPSLDA